MPRAVASVRVSRRDALSLALYIRIRIHGGIFWHRTLLNVGSLSDITSNAHAHYESLAYGMK